MIAPGPNSVLRPVIAAFYAASYRVEPGWGVDRCGWTFRDALAAGGLRVEAASRPELSWVVNGRIGVLVLPSAALLTDAVRARVRRALSADGALEVALLATFHPRPRLARVDAPRHADVCAQTAG